MSDEVYKKKLVAKFNPKNECYVPDGEFLTVFPRDEKLLLDSLDHYFSGVIEPDTKSKYGWVQSSEPFTLESFISKYRPFGEATQEELSHVQTMLKSISKIADDQPVAAIYSLRGILDKEMVFTVHKVIFY